MKFADMPPTIVRPRGTESRAKRILYSSLEERARQHVRSHHSGTDRCCCRSRGRRNGEVSTVNNTLRAIQLRAITATCAPRKSAA